jgi:hypothetical protein
VIGPCTVQIPVRKLPAHVRVVRHGRLVAKQPGRSPHRQVVLLRRGDRVQVTTPGRFAFSYAGNRYVIRHGSFELQCPRVLLDAGPRHDLERVLAIALQSGQVRVQSGRAHTREALVLTPEMLALATDPNTTFKVDRNPRARGTRAWTLDRAFVAARASDQTLRIRARLTYTAISNARGLRLDVWPFPISAAERAPTPADGLVPFWSDGVECSVGCPAPGAIPGWPIRPFHQQHAIRSALNELRPANFHIGIDIEARDFEPVYPIQSGVVRVIGAGTADEHVQVGQFSYWHINHMVSDGQFAVAYRTELGTVKFNFKHVHLSELGPQGQYLNPLRPGGRMLSPYRDIDPPQIATPHVYSDGRAIVAAFDPQSFAERASYETPVLAPAALAWRLFDSRGHALTGLEWALRGSHNYATSLKPRIFAPGARNPGYGCFASRRLCIPNWVYLLAGGLTQPLPLSGLPRGRYRLSVYAWDWAGNVTALDDWITVPLASTDRAPGSSAVAAFDYQ